MTNILFVCLGNICRSPAAEGVMWELIKKSGMNSQLFCDSAGTSAFHENEPADGRMREHALKRGFKLNSISRQFVLADFDKFDLILTMDNRNFNDIKAIDYKNEFEKKVVPFTSFCTIHNFGQVPDPYSGGYDGFEQVMDIVEDGCQGLFKNLIKTGQIKLIDKK